MDSDRTASTRRYLTNQEAADFLHLSPRTLNKQRVYGGGPQFHKFGSRVLYAMADLETWEGARLRCDIRSGVSAAESRTAGA